MAATCMAVCKGSRKKIRGIFISSCHLPVAVECDIVILSEPGPIPQAPVGQFCRHNLSPRGDGNLGELLALRQLDDTTYPREGTETNAQKAIRKELETQLIPARGRKPATTPKPAGGRRTQLIPARGRKLFPVPRPGGFPGHNLSPRGDGNSPVERQDIMRYNGHNLSPRGDGNCGASGGQAVCRDTTYPREGTETYLSS